MFVGSKKIQIVKCNGSADLFHTETLFDNQFHTGALSLKKDVFVCRMPNAAEKALKMLGDLSTRQFSSRACRFTVNEYGSQS